MKNKGSFFLSAAMLVTAVLMEVFWIQTGAETLGVFSLLAALVASGALAHSIRLDYASADAGLRRFLTVTGLER